MQEIDWGFLVKCLFYTKLHTILNEEYSHFTIDLDHFRYFLQDTSYSRTVYRSISTYYTCCTVFSLPGMSIVQEKEEKAWSW